MQYSTLQRHWQYAARQLNLKIHTPFTLDLEDGSKIFVEIHLEGYGARNGMLIASDYAAFNKKTDLIIKLGYGFSCMSQPNKVDIESLDGFNDILEDWGKI